MTPQAIFDKVVTHLAAQKGPARDSEGICFYLAEDGKRCAIGCLLSLGDAIGAQKEGGFVESITRNLPPELLEHLPLLAQLQRSHDVTDTRNELHTKLTEVAEAHGLSAANVSKITEWNVIG